MTCSLGFLCIATQKFLRVQVGSLASAAAELKALNIGVTLQALQVDTKADAQELMNGWLAVLETSKPPLSEHRSHLLAALHGAKAHSCLQSWYLFFWRD